MYWLGSSNIVVWKNVFHSFKQSVRKSCGICKLLISDLHKTWNLCKGYPIKIYIERWFQVFKLIIQSNNKKMKKTATTNKNETERWKEKPQKTKCNMMMNVTKRSPYRLQTCVPFLSWFIRGPTWLHVVKILLVWWFYYNLWCLGWCISVFFL